MNNDQASFYFHFETKNHNLQKLKKSQKVKADKNFDDARVICNSPIHSCLLGCQAFDQEWS